MMIAVIRPLAEDCIHPHERDRIIGKKITKIVEEGEHFSNANIALQIRGKKLLVSELWKLVI